MEYMESKIQEQYDAQNELIKEISRLQDLLAKHGICEDCGELYNHHFDEPLASCGCKQSEWYELTPHMKQVLELKAERNALAAKAARLEKKITAINDGIAEYKEMANDATADLVHKALMDVREEIIQRDLYQSAPDFIEKFANEYAAKVRKGGE